MKKGVSCIYQFYISYDYMSQTKKRKRENYMNIQKFLKASRISSEEANRNFMEKLTKLTNHQLLKNEDKKTKLRIQNYLYRPIQTRKVNNKVQNLLLLKNELKKHKFKAENILYRPTRLTKVNKNKQLLTKEIRKYRALKNSLYIPHKSPTHTGKPKGTAI